MTTEERLAPPWTGASIISPAGEQVGCMAVDETSMPQSYEAWLEALNELAQPGNMENLAVLMRAFVRGRNLVNDFFRRVTDIQSVDLRIPDSPIQFASYMYDYANDSSGLLDRATVIQRRHLDMMSWADPEETLSRERAGKLSHVSNLDYYFLAGVEETHHAVFRQLSPGSPPPHNFLRFLELTPDEYSAQEVEWQALGFRIKFALEESLPGNTIDCLMRESRGSGSQGCPGATN